MLKPTILEAYNVERAVAVALEAGGNGQGTVIGNMLANAAQALGNIVIRWEPIKEGKAWHLRLHLSSV